NAPRFDATGVTQVTGHDAQEIASEIAQHPSTFCNIGTALCFGEAYQGHNIWIPSGNQMDANTMVQYWQAGGSARMKHFGPDDRREPWQIAECGGFVWAGVDKTPDTGHVWSLTSRAETGLPQSHDPGTNGAGVPVFHVGGGAPHRGLLIVDAGGSWMLHK